MVRYFWTRVLLEPGVQKQGLEEEIKQQGIAEEIQEKYCVVILHFASGKLTSGKKRNRNPFINLQWKIFWQKHSQKKSKWKM